MVICHLKHEARLAWPQAEARQRLQQAVAEMGTRALPSPEQESLQHLDATQSGLSLVQPRSTAPSPAVAAQDRDFSILAAAPELEAAISSDPSAETTTPVPAPSASVPMHLQREDEPVVSAASESIHESYNPNPVSSSRPAGKPKVRFCAERTTG